MPARRWGGSGARERGTQRREVPLCPPSIAVARQQEPLDASTRVRTRRGRHDHHRRHVRRRPLEDGVVEEARDGRLLLQAAGHPRRLRHGARRVSASSTGSAADRQAAGRRHVVQAAEGITNIDPPRRTRLCRWVPLSPVEHNLLSALPSVVSRLLHFIQRAI